MTAPEQELKELPILAVDDEASNLLLLERVLEREGYSRVTATTDPASVAALCDELSPALILLDLHMPVVDGFEVMDLLADGRDEGPGVPILVLTADATDDTKRRALRAGARDFLTKPLDQIELLIRVRNLLQVQYLQSRLAQQNATLEAEVAERTHDLEHARLEILERLAVAAEFRDDETQQHAGRIGRTCALLGGVLGMPKAEAELLRRAALLHDIGKIGISDLILLKPGRLSAEEFELVKRHTTIGAQILAGSKSPLLKLAREIALTHHERWDGGGYPDGRGGEDIPLAGRIVAVADVFDALTHERPYKQPWPVEDAVTEVLSQAGRQFDPKVVDAFARLNHQDLLAPVADAGGVPQAEMLHV